MKFLALLLILLLPSVALAADPVRRMYVFGDSYSDMGNGYVDGNGPTAVAYLAKRLGFKLVPANTPGDSLNFAVSGATTGGEPGKSVPEGRLGYGMRNQVRDFTSMVASGHAKFDPATTLFFLAGGLNDSRLPTEVTVANLEAEFLELYAAGARRFEVAILPTAIPGFRNTALRLNPALQAIPAEMRAKLPGATIKTSEWGAFFDDVMQHAAAYGFTNTTDRCAGRAIFHEDPTPCADPDKYFYYHAAHPSTAVQKIVGDKLYNEVTKR